MPPKGATSKSTPKGSSLGAAPAGVTKRPRAELHALKDKKNALVAKLDKEGEDKEKINKEIENVDTEMQDAVWEDEDATSGLGPSHPSGVVKDEEKSENNPNRYPAEGSGNSSSKSDKAATGDQYPGALSMEDLRDRQPGEPIKCRKRNDIDKTIIDYIVQYGPKKAPMFSFEGANDVIDPRGNLEDITDGTVRRAYARDTSHKRLVNKDKYAGIRCVAWSPREEWDTIDDLMKTVEELNPAKMAAAKATAKEQGKRAKPYGMTYCLTVWNDGADTWEPRSDLRALRGKGMDRLIYEVAKKQVERHRQWIAEDPSVRGVSKFPSPQRGFSNEGSATPEPSTETSPPPAGQQATAGPTEAKPKETRQNDSPSSEAGTFSFADFQLVFAETFEKDVAELDSNERVEMMDVWVNYKKQKEALGLVLVKSSNSRG